MEDSESFAKLTTIFRDVFDDDIELRPEMTADDVVDRGSVSHIRLVLTIERRFHKTVWGGVVGAPGLERIKAAQSDPAGEARLTSQRTGPGAATSSRLHRRVEPRLRRERARGPLTHAP